MAAILEEYTEKDKEQNKKIFALTVKMIVNDIDSLAPVVGKRNCIFGRHWQCCIRLMTLFLNCFSVFVTDLIN